MKERGIVEREGSGSSSPAMNSAGIFDDECRDRGGVGDAIDRKTGMGDDGGKLTAARRVGRDDAAIEMERSNAEEARGEMKCGANDRSETKKSSHAGRQGKSRRGRTIIRASTESDNASNVQGSLDDIRGYGSDDSRVSICSAIENERSWGQSEYSSMFERKRQPQKKKLAEAQRQKDQPECIDVDHEEEIEQGRRVKELVQKYGDEHDYDQLIADDDEKINQRKKGKGRRGNSHGASAFAGLSWSAPNGGRMRNRDRRHPMRSHLESRNRVFSNHSDDPLDIARSQQEADSPKRSSSSRAHGGHAGEKPRGRGDTLAQNVGGFTGKLERWGKGGMAAKGKKQAETTLKLQAANDHNGGQSPGEKRKLERRSYWRGEGALKKMQFGAKGSFDSAIDVDDDDTAIDRNNQTDESSDLMVANEGSGPHYVGHEDYGHLNANKNDRNSSEWEDAGTKDANFGVTRDPRARSRSTKASGKQNGNAVADTNEYLRGTNRGANSDKLVEITSPDSIPKLHARAGKPDVNERITKKNTDCIQENEPWIPRNERKPATRSTKLLKKMKSQGSMFMFEDEREAWGDKGSDLSSREKRISPTTAMSDEKRKAACDCGLSTKRPSIANTGCANSDVQSAKRDQQQIVDATGSPTEKAAKKAKAIEALTLQLTSKPKWLNVPKHLAEIAATQQGNETFGLCCDWLWNNHSDELGYDKPVLPISHCPHAGQVNLGALNNAS